MRVPLDVYIKRFLEENKLTFLSLSLKHLIIPGRRLRMEKKRNIGNSSHKIPFQEMKNV